MKDLCLENKVNLNWAKVIDYETTCSVIFRATSTHIGRPFYGEFLDCWLCLPSKSESYNDVSSCSYI